MALCMARQATPPVQRRSPFLSAPVGASGPNRTDSRCLAEPRFIGAQPIFEADLVKPPGQAAGLAVGVVGVSGPAFGGGGIHAGLRPGGTFLRVLFHNETPQAG